MAMTTDSGMKKGILEAISSLKNCLTKVGGESTLVVVIVEGIAVVLAATAT